MLKIIESICGSAPQLCDAIHKPVSLMCALPLKLCSINCTASQADYSNTLCCAYVQLAALDSLVHDGDVTFADRTRKLLTQQGMDVAAWEREILILEAVAAGKDPATAAAAATVLSGSRGRAAGSPKHFGRAHAQSARERRRSSSMTGELTVCVTSEGSTIYGPSQQLSGLGQHGSEVQVITQV